MNELNSNIDFTEMIKMAQSMKQNEVVPPTLSPIDRTINTQGMRILKASLPYFDYSKQRNFAMLVKMLEFKKTLEIFNSPTIHTTLHQKKELNTLEFLNDIKNSCDEPEQKNLNLLISLLNMKSTLENAKNNPQLLISDEPKPDIDEKVPPGNDYNNFMNMVNKIIDEKEGE